MAKSQKLKVKYLLKGMALLGYDAINLGEKDLQYGIEFLQETRDEYQLPFISANVYAANTGELFAKPYIVKEIGGTRIGIFGITTADRVEQLVKPELGFKLQDPLTAATAVVEQLRGQCDVIVALSHLALKGNNELIEKVPGIDIVLSGHQGYHLRSPKKMNNSWMMQPGSQGKYLGHLDLSISSNTISEVQGKTVSLGKEIPDDPALVKLVEEFDEELLLAFPLESPKGKLGASKLNERMCRGCHLQQYRQWTSTLHSHAWQTLVDKKQAHNPECQQCHTSLHGEENGFTKLSETPDMVNVQCAECHRMAVENLQAHIDNSMPKRSASNGKTRQDFQQISEQTCLKCHNEENSPEFDYAKFLSKVIH